MIDSIEWSPVVVRLGDLSHWVENPVTLTKVQARKLLKSTEKLGRMQTLAIGPANGNGKHPLYDGHQRVNVWGGAFGMDLEVNALQSSRPLTDDECHAVPIMLRTATGSLDWDVLSSWPAENLTQWGMDDALLTDWKRDIAALGNLIESEETEKLVFSEDDLNVPGMDLLPYEKYDYVLLTFKKQYEFDEACHVLGLETRRDPRGGWAQHVGLCRVIDGVEIIRKLSSGNSHSEQEKSE